MTYNKNGVIFKTDLQKDKFSMAVLGRLALLCVYVLVQGRWESTAPDAAGP
jgi:hypothetical protein